MEKHVRKKRKILLRWNEFRENKIAFALAAISGALLILPFPKLDLWWTAWFGMVPLFIALRSKTPKLAFYLGLTFGFIFYYGNVFWLNTLFDYNYFVPIGIVLLGIYLAFYGAFFSLLSAVVRNNAGAFSFFLIPGIWVVLEFIRSLGRLAFPWAFLSASQCKVLPIIQISDITGTYGISYLIVICNLALAETIEGLRTRSILRQVWKPAVAAALIGASLLYGAHAMKREYAGEERLKVAIVQPSVPQPFKLLSYLADDPELRERLSSQMISQLESMIKSAEGSNVDLFVLPESAITQPGFNFDVELHRFVKRLAQEVDAPIFLGADNRSGPEEDDDIYNSAWLIDSQNGLYPKPYNKIQLVPFGEHVPYFSMIPYFQEIIINIGSFKEGSDYTLFPCKDYQFGAVICFESSFAYLLRRFVRDGADFLVVITNDAWYKRSAGAYQHNSLSVFRAIENRRYVARSANTGISCLIAPTGRILSRLSLYERTVLIGEIRPSSLHLTFYTRYGDIFAESLLVFVCIVFAAMLTVKFKAHKQQ